jgi:two-component system NtrC family sensor kinase
MRLRLRGLQVEIVSSLFVVMLAGIAVLSVVMGSLAARTVERSAMDQLRVSARYLERLAVIGSLRLSDLSAVAQTIAAHRSGIRWRVFDAQGREVGQGADVAVLELDTARVFDAARRSGEVIERGGFPLGDVVLVSRLHTPSGQRGFIVGVVTRAVLMEKLSPLLRSGAWVLTIAAALFVAFGAYLLRRRIVLPVHQLSAATRSVAEGDLTVRTSLSGGDELVALAANFNRMAESLERERTALFRATESLTRSERLASVGRLAAGVAHEVGNPVGAILGYTELALRDSGLSQRSREAAEQIRREALRVRELVRELLDLARSEELRFEPAQPLKLLERVCHRMAGQEILRDVQLTVVGNPELGPVMTDARRVEQILVNLIENAAHALAGQAAAQIELDCRPAQLNARSGRRRDDPKRSSSEATRRPDAVALCVTDNGPGIDAAVLSQVFDPFFTTKDPGKGTGLGLWNGHRLAELLGGRLEVESASGRTQFSLVLPASDTEDPDGRPTRSDYR